MGVFAKLVEPLLCLLFMGVQVGLVPGLIAYFVERFRLRNGNPRCRAWKIALAGAILLGITIALALILDAEAGFASFIFTFFAASILFGVAVGIDEAWRKFQKNSVASTDAEI